MLNPVGSPPKPPAKPASGKKHKVNVAQSARDDETKEQSDDEDDTFDFNVLRGPARKSTDILLDNQATCSVFNNKKLFSKLWEEEDAIRES